MKTIKLNSIVKLIRGITYKKEQAIKAEQTEHLPLFRANNIQKGQIFTDDILYIPQSLISEEQLINKNDIIISMSSGSKSHVGKVAFANKNYKASYGAFCAKIYVTGANPKYIFLSLQSSDFRNYIESKSKGTNINNLTRSFILDYEIPLPTLPEQEKIILKIEELFSELDKGIKELEQAKARLKVYRQSVLKNAFEGEKIKYHTQLSELTTLITKGASPKWQGFNYIDSKDELLFITSENVLSGKISLAKEKYLPLAFNEHQKRSTLKENDVLFNIVGASLGRCAVFALNQVANINQAVALIRPVEELRSNYLMYFLNSALAKNQYVNNVVDVARANLSLADISKFIIPLPQTLEQQKQIVEQIESKLSICDNIEKTITDSLKKAESLRQSILKKAFNGELV